MHLYDQLAYIAVNQPINQFTSDYMDSYQWKRKENEKEKNGMKHGNKSLWTRYLFYSFI